MYVVCVSVFVTPGDEERFISAVEGNHLGTVSEPGAARFDVLQAVDDSSHFFLYEVYHDQEAFMAHQHTEHYLAWRKTVEPWMARPREATKFNSIFPVDEQS